MSRHTLTMARVAAALMAGAPVDVRPAPPARRLDLDAICAELQKRLPEVDTVARCLVTELRGVRLLLVATEKSVAAGRQFALTADATHVPQDTEGCVQYLLEQFRDTVRRADAGETWWTREPLAKPSADQERLAAAQAKRERRARRRLQ